MSATGRPETAATAPALAEQLQSAEFVRLIAAETGGAVAAAGLLADALSAAGTPYQMSVVGLPGSATSETDADLTVAVGRSAAVAETAVGTGGQPAATTAYEAAAALGTVDLHLALAGVVASGETPGDELLSAAEQQGIGRRPGVAQPGVEPADALAHSTLVHAPFSGDIDEAAAVLADHDLPAGQDEEARGRLASLVALSVAGDEDATARGTVAVERALRPHTGGPFETVGGFADVLTATARRRPGLATVLALGGGDRETALSVWRRHGQAAHEGVRTASTGRYDGLYVAQCAESAPVGTVARLLCAYRSPEPLVVAVGDGVAEARRARDGTTEQAVGKAVQQAAQAVGGAGGGTAVRGRATFDVTPTEFVAALREAV